MRVLDQVREINANWLQNYNEKRPHDALASLPPATYRANLEARNSYRLGGEAYTFGGSAPRRRGQTATRVERDDSMDRIYFSGEIDTMRGPATQTPVFPLSSRSVRGRGAVGEGPPAVRL